MRRDDAEAYVGVNVCPEMNPNRRRTMDAMAENSALPFIH